MENRVILTQLLAVADEKVYRDATALRKFLVLDALEQGDVSFDRFCDLYISRASLPDFMSFIDFKERYKARLKEDYHHIVEEDYEDRCTEEGASQVPEEV